VRYVHSNARDVRKIRRRQACATLKREAVKRSGVRAQTVRVTFVSRSKHNKTEIGIARKQKSADRKKITRSTSNNQCGECTPQRTRILRAGCDVTHKKVESRS
jgi:hypothetical protein